MVYSLKYAHVAQQLLEKRLCKDEALGFFPFTKADRTPALAFFLTPSKHPRVEEKRLQGSLTGRPPFQLRKRDIRAFHAAFEAFQSSSVGEVAPATLTLIQSRMTIIFQSTSIGRQEIMSGGKWISVDTPNVGRRRTWMGR